MSNVIPRAIVTLVVGIQAWPDWEVGRIRLADILMKQKKLQQAGQVLADGVRLLPESITMRTGLAKVELSIGEPSAALKLLEPVVKKYEAERSQNEETELLNEYVAPLGTYSLALYRARKVDDAIRMAREVYAIAPVDVANSNNLAWMLATEKKAIPEATELIRMCLRLAPDNPQVLDTAGWIAFLRGDLEPAIDYLTQSVKQDDNADARYHMAQVYEKRDRLAEAREQYAQAIKLGLTGRDLEYANQRLLQLPKQ
jgi:tetratricopeptide (TPR) repeat protein